jgi:hypothetical protein
VNWAGFSQVEAMLALMNCALPSMDKDDRIMFLSGSDFPIRDLQTINQFFSRHPETEFLEYFYLEGRNSDVRRSSNYHRWDLRYFKKRGSLFYKFNTLMIRILTVLETILRGKKEFTSLHLASGSQWFSITKSCASELLSLRTVEYDLYFKTYFAPDESYFATLFSQSKFNKSNLNRGALTPVAGKSRLWQARNLTYVDETLDRWLTLLDLPNLVKSNYLFARKFDSALSSSLVVHLEKTIRPQH